MGRKLHSSPAKNTILARTLECMETMGETDGESTIYGMGGKRGTHPIFREMSNLVMTLMLTILMGREFEEKYGEELVPMIQAYEWALQRPQTKALPRWLSDEGRILESVEARMKQLVREEVLHRLENPEKYEMNMDY